MKESPKNAFRFHFRKSEHNGRSAEEIIQLLVDTTIKKVLSEHDKTYYNSLKA